MWLNFATIVIIEEVYTQCEKTVLINQLQFIR